MEFIVLTTGLSVVIGLTVKSLLERTVVPPMVGYILLGILIRLCDTKLNFMTAECTDVFEFLSKKNALLIGASMTPRAEIAMIVMQRGLKSGGLINSRIYGAMIILCIGTCLISPFVVEIMLKRWPLKKKQD